MKVKQKIILLSLVIFSSTLYAILNYLVYKEYFRGIDYYIMQVFQTNISRNFDKPLSLFTVLGSSEISLLILFLIFIILFIRKKYVFSGLILFITIFVIEILGKLFIYHPGPPIIFNRYALKIFFPSSFIVHTVSSFPSGHMARGAFIATLLILFLIKRNKYCLKNFLGIFLNIIFIVGMFVSRIYLGEHWFSDVLGGLILGNTIALLSFSFW